MGGQLRVHLDSRPEAATEEVGPRLAGEEEQEQAGRKWDIEPVLDRLVLFRSDLVDHEVRNVLGVWPVVAGCPWAVTPKLFIVGRKNRVCLQYSLLFAVLRCDVIFAATSREVSTDLWDRGA